MEFPLVPRAKHKEKILSEIIIKKLEVYVEGNPTRIILQERVEYNIDNQSIVCGIMIM